MVCPEWETAQVCIRSSKRTTTASPASFPIALRTEIPIDGGFRETLLEIYVPRYGAGWEADFLDGGPVYARIDADRMFTFAMGS